MSETTHPSRYSERALALSREIATSEAEARAIEAEAVPHRERAQVAKRKRLELIEEMRRDKLTWKQIGAELGITESAASHLGRKHGID